MIRVSSRKTELKTQKFWLINFIRKIKQELNFSFTILK